MQPPATQTVRSITCFNAGAFDMKFRVEWLDANNEGQSTPWTDAYPVEQSQTIDLGVFNLPAGTEIWARVHAEGGESKNCHPRVIFDPSGENNATYRVSGTTLDIHSELEGV